MTILPWILGCGLSLDTGETGEYSTNSQDSPSINISDCSSDNGNHDVAGEWEIEGEGSLYGCHDHHLNHPIKIQSTALQVLQTTNGELFLQNDIPGFSFDNGVISGACVSFTTAEELESPYTSISFSFEGIVETNDWGFSIEGNFSSMGPENCSGNGTFSINGNGLL